jgi:pyrimidine-nucleoside phosphorylase
LTTDLRDAIARKRDGFTLSQAEIERFVGAAADGSGTDEQLASMLMAIFIRGLSTPERTAIALAMMRSGDLLTWDHLDRPTIDKHSTGGVGDKVSLIWGPLMASVGYAVPMISGRGLGHTGGTLDKLEAIPGYRTDLTSDEMDAVVQLVGCSITGQTGSLVPADKRLYDLRSRTATVPTVDHIAPSILSKKFAEGAATLVLDVKCGSGAFMKERAQARQLAEVMVDMGREAGRNMAALITDMGVPLGAAIGNAVEVVESVQVLRGGGDPRLRELVLDLAEDGVRSAGGDVDRAALIQALDSGDAWTSFVAMVEAQGGDASTLERPGALRGSDGLTELVLEAPADGWVDGLDALELGLAVDELGGGRGPDGSAPDPGVGAWLEVGFGERVTRGQPWARLLHRERGLPAALARMTAGLSIGDEPPPRPTVLERLA